ncbi:MAG: hypothetical protein ACK5XP_07605 [Sphingobacteriia bacterium]
MRRKSIGSRRILPQLVLLAFLLPGSTQVYAQGRPVAPTPPPGQ